MKNNKGFSLLEMLACLLIISALMLVSLRNTNNLNLDHYYYLNDYLYNQSKAIIQKQDTYLSKGISFNSMGKVNQARTIDFNSHKVIVHLGNGYVTYE